MTRSRPNDPQSLGRGSGGFPCHHPGGDGLSPGLRCSRGSRRILKYLFAAAVVALGVCLPGQPAPAASRGNPVHLLGVWWSPRGNAILLDVEDQVTQRLHVERLVLGDTRPLEDLTP